MHVYINILRERHTKASKWAICNKCQYSGTIFYNIRNYEAQIIYTYIVDIFDFLLAVYIDVCYYTVCKNGTKLWIN